MEERKPLEGEYLIAEVKLFDADKVYAFALYPETIPDENTGVDVLIDTVYGLRAGTIIHIYSKDEWVGDLPYKQVVCPIRLEEYKVRESRRKRKNDLRDQLIESIIDWIDEDPDNALEQLGSAIKQQKALYNEYTEWAMLKKMGA